MSTHTLAVNRREFLEIAGAGLLIVAAAPPSEAQRGGGAGALETRLHIAEDGFITILTGKIEEGQGALTELTMAAAEELRVPLDRVRMVMGDTDQVPNDGTTAGSGTTPRTVPLVRSAAAAARELLLAAAAGSGAWMPRGSRCAMALSPTRARPTATPTWRARPNWRRPTKRHCPRARQSPARRTGRCWERLRSGWTAATSSPARIAILAILCGRACSTAACCERRPTGRRWRAWTSRRHRRCRA